MPHTISLGDISADVQFKDIKNVHLTVHPPTGEVRISVPLRTDIDTVRAFAISKLDWIRRKQRALREQDRELPREFLDRESHYVWGRRVLLEVIESSAAHSVEPMHSKLVLRVRPGTRQSKRRELIEGWYREQVRNAALSLINEWGPLIGVDVEKLFVQGMKTRWGSCNPKKKNIRLNTELAKKPPECLEYIVVHEMAHLLEASHNSDFVEYMDRLLPDWRRRRDQLRQLPVRDEAWGRSHEGQL